MHICIYANLKLKFYSKLAYCSVTKPHNYIVDTYTIPDICYGIQTNVYSMLCICVIELEPVWVREIQLCLNCNTKHLVVACSIRNTDKCIKILES